MPWCRLISTYSSDVVLGPWSLVVLKDKVSVFGPGIGLEPRVLVNITGIFSIVMVGNRVSRITRFVSTETLNSISKHSASSSVYIAMVEWA